MASGKEHSDSELLRLYAAGDPKAATELTSRFLPLVYHHARRLLGDQSEAEDVAQEAMLRLWRVAPQWRDGHAKVSTWLFRVTGNLCVDRLRKRRGIPLEDAAEPISEAPDAETQLQIRSRDMALQSALSRLPDRQRQAVVLRHLEGLGNADIAGIMGITPRAVESLTARGKRALADMLITRRQELGFENDG